MNTPPTPIPSAPNQSVPTVGNQPLPPKQKPWLGVLLGVVLILVAATVGYYGWLWSNAPSVTDTTSPTSASSPAATDDPVAKELGAVSTKIDTSTLKAEIADTPTTDLTAELDNIDAAVNGL